MTDRFVQDLLSCTTLKQINSEFDLKYILFTSLQNVKQRQKKISQKHTEN